MKFEHAFRKLRKGAKIRHPSWPEDEYIMACYVRLIGDDTSEKILSIVKMQGDKPHPTMVPYMLRQGHIFDNQPPCGEKDIHLYPQISLLHLMYEDWEIYNG